jgi:hypothetical protein
MHCGHIYHFMGRISCHAPTFMDWYFAVTLIVMMAMPVIAVIGGICSAIFSKEQP